MLEEKLARIKKLMEQRDKINAELAEMVGMNAPTKRGRPRKDHDNTPVAAQETSESTESSVGRG